MAAVSQSACSSHQALAVPIPGCVSGLPLSVLADRMPEVGATFRGNRSDPVGTQVGGQSYC